MPLLKKNVRLNEHFIDSIYYTTIQEIFIKLYRLLITLKIKRLLQLQLKGISRLLPVTQSNIHINIMNALTKTHTYKNTWINK